MWLLIALLCGASAFAASALWVPVLLWQRRALARATSRSRMAASIVEALALAIEARDRTSERHIRRMRVYASGIGRRLGMSPAELEELEYAALLHDIGKLVVPDSVLSKPSTLSHEEFRMMSTHARIGAEILETIGMPASMAAMVRHHHERYDGTGYPDGLIGMEIPLGARILAAVDTFEATTSERPHRRGMPVQDAVAHLTRSSGTLFDPRVVGALLEQHADLEKAAAEEERLLPRGSSPGAPRDGDSPRACVSPLQMVLDRISSSHLEIYSLNEVGQAMGRTLDLDVCLALMTGRLQRLTHYAACAVFLLDEHESLLRVRFAMGAGAAELRGLAIPVGHRTSGLACVQRHAVSSSGAPGQSGDTGRRDLELLDGDAETAGLTSELAVPLLLDDRVVGVIALYDGPEADYSPREELLVELSARQMSRALRAGLMAERASSHALTDSLTGLPNSRYIRFVFTQEASRARAYGVPLTLLVIDVDDFHEVNRDFGHHAGDRILAGISRLIRAQMRLLDTCARDSGDRFVAIMPGLSEADAQEAISRIEKAAAEYDPELPPGRTLRLALSIGCATMPADGEEFEALLAGAQRALEQQRARRRGEVVNVVSFQSMAMRERHR